MVSLNDRRKALIEREFQYCKVKKNKIKHLFKKKKKEDFRYYAVEPLLLLPPVNVWSFTGLVQGHRVYSKNWLVTKKFTNSI